MDLTLQTRREKILEARNKEIRLKEKTKVINNERKMVLIKLFFCRVYLVLEALVVRRVEVRKLYKSKYSKSGKA